VIAVSGCLFRVFISEVDTVSWANLKMLNTYFLSLISKFLRIVWAKFFSTINAFNFLAFSFCVRVFYFCIAEGFCLSFILARRAGILAAKVTDPQEKELVCL